MARCCGGIRNILALLGLLVVLVTTTPVLRYWTTALSSKWGNDAGDTLVVLGGSSISDDMLGASSYWRAFYGVLLARQNHYRQIIVSGKGVAPLMRELMVNQGVRRDLIVVENASESTRENALYCAKLLRGNAGRIVLLTSDFHAGRAQRAFGRVGVTVSALPYPDVGKRMWDWRERWSLFVVLAEETVKVAYYHWEGWD